MTSLVRLSRCGNGRRFDIAGVSTDDGQRAATRFLPQFGFAYENTLGAAILPPRVLVDAEGGVVLKVNRARQRERRESLALIVNALQVAGIRAAPALAARTAICEKGRR